jgi:hypothetical protein
MPYTPPATFAHGDYPTAANINLFKTGLDAIHDLAGDAVINPAVLELGITAHSYAIVNRYRWLLFLGSGRIDDPFEGEESVTISGSVSEWTTYDLTQIEWITPGRVYQVEAVSAAFEDYEAV